MEKSIRQSIPDNDNTKDFMRSVREKFKTFDKAQKGHFLKRPNMMVLVVFMSI